MLVNNAGHSSCSGSLGQTEMFNITAQAYIIERRVFFLCV